ncbi:MAG TPA: ATP-dependent zinc metalloprotease FtsH [Treponemataceae bacterium]|nr:ATP-dependent zinc metalloprotease FtsH [Treponemataceae bacterium]
MNENPKKDPNNENDPFNFFKLSTDPKNDKNKKSPKIPFWAILLGVLIITTILNFVFTLRSDSTLDFTEFKALVSNGVITEVVLDKNYFIGYGPQIRNTDTNIFGTLSPSRETYKTVAIWTEGFLEFLDEKGVAYKAQLTKNNFLLDFLLQWILPFGFIFLMWRFLMKRMGGGMGGGLGGSIFSAGQSRANAVDEGQVTTRFADVAGVDEAKEELIEVVDFLKSPKKYTDIGGKIPKGVLLVGPPGTGKTLLARAVAGEARVPFFRISGSDFVEMFVGVGASRVRDLFKQAREKSPCIVFIDELDAIGKSRVTGYGGGNDEREQTLNQLLVEMDGFDNSTGLILLAATNRPDVLDPALLRPGRFDRQVVVDRPDFIGREAILKIHAKNVKLDNDVDLPSIAKTTSGFSGADLANIVNEAALLAVRGGRKKVAMIDFNEAVEKTVAGLQKKSRVIKEEERRIVAYHETGHALTAAFTEGADKVHKISIIPRGVAALGYTMQMPEDDRYLRTRKELLGEVDVLLGGRAAEKIQFSEISTGAGNDLQRATDIIRRMITDYGMSEKFENVALTQRGGAYGYGGEPQLIREYSEETQRYIDSELARLMAERYTFVTENLMKNKDLLDYIANRLLEKETIDATEFKEIISAHKNLQEKISEDVLDSGSEKAKSSEKEEQKEA